MPVKWRTLETRYNTLQYNANSVITRFKCWLPFRWELHPATVSTAGRDAWSKICRPPALCNTRWNAAAARSTLYMYVSGSVYARRRRPSSMFLTPNTWPSVAVCSVQLQLMCGTVCQRKCSLLSHESLDIFRRRLKTELYECSYNWHCACQTTLLVCVTHFHFPCSFLLWPQPWSLSTIHSMTFILDNNPTWHTIGHFEDKSREEAKQQLVQFMLCRWSAPQRLTFWHW